MFENNVNFKYFAFSSIFNAKNISIWNWKFASYAKYLWWNKCNFNPIALFYLICFSLQRFVFAFVYTIQNPTHLMFDGFWFVLYVPLSQLQNIQQHQQRFESNEWMNEFILTTWTWKVVLWAVFQWNRHHPYFYPYGYALYWIWFIVDVMNGCKHKPILTA